VISAIREVYYQISLKIATLELLQKDLLPDRSFLHRRRPPRRHFFGMRQ
jgi:hypothetical protein